MPPAAPAPRSLGRPRGQGWAPQAAASAPARGGSRRQGPRSRRRPGRGPSQRRDVKMPGSGPKTPHGSAPPQQLPLRAGSRAGSPTLPGGPGAPRPAPLPAPLGDAAAVLHPRLPHWMGEGGCACAASASPPGRGGSPRGSAGAGPGRPLPTGAAGAASGGVARGGSGLGWGGLESADRPSPVQP
nr:uncharacterized protein LOC113459274 [Zonotrichia albicollis]